MWVQILYLQNLPPVNFGKKYIFRIFCRFLLDNSKSTDFNIWVAPYIQVLTFLFFENPSDLSLWYENV